MCANLSLTFRRNVRDSIHTATYVTLFHKSRVHLRRKEIESKKLAQRIARIALDKKAEDLVILEMSKVANFCDYFVILSTTSLRQAHAIADAIQGELAEEKIGCRSHPVGAQKESGWVLLDLNSVIVHIFYKPLREFYALEHLWQDAPRLRVRRPSK